MKKTPLIYLLIISMVLPCPSMAYEATAFLEDGGPAEGNASNVPMTASVVSGTAISGTAISGTLKEVFLITGSELEIEYDGEVLNNEDAHATFTISVDGKPADWEFLSYFDFGPYEDRGGVVNVRLKDSLDVGKPRVQRRAVTLFDNTQNAKGATAAARITVITSPKAAIAAFKPFYEEVQLGHMSQIEAWGATGSGNSATNDFTGTIGEPLYNTDYLVKQLGEGINGMVGRSEYLNIPVIDAGLQAHVVGSDQSVYEDPAYRELYIHGSTEDTYTRNHIPGTVEKPIIVTTADEVMRHDSEAKAEGDPARPRSDYFQFGEDFLRLYYHFGVLMGSPLFPNGQFDEANEYRYDLQLKNAYDKAMKVGKWKGTIMAESVENYYIYGAMIHFEMIPESVDGSWKSDRFPVNTREELHDYDNDLYRALCGIHGRYHWFTGTPEQSFTDNDFTNDMLKLSHPWFWHGQADNYSTDGERGSLAIEHVQIISDDQIEIKFNREIETVEPAALAGNWKVYIDGKEVSGTYTTYDWIWVNGGWELGPVQADRVSAIGGYAWRTITLQVVPEQGSLDNGKPYGRDFSGFTEDDIKERCVSNNGWIDDDEEPGKHALDYGEMVTLQDAIDAGAGPVGKVEVEYVGSDDVEDWAGNALDKNVKHIAAFQPWIGNAYRSPLTGFYIYADTVVAKDTMLAAAQLYESDMLNNQTVTYKLSAGGEDFPDDPTAQVVNPQNNSDRSAVTKMLNDNPDIGTSKVKYDRVGQRIADGSVKGGGGMQLIGGYTYGHHAAMQPTHRDQIRNGFHVWLYVEGWGGTVFQSDETMLLKDAQMTRYKNENLVFHEGGHGLDSFTGGYYANEVYNDITAAWLTSISYENGRRWWNQYNKEGAYLRNRDEYTSTGSTFYHSTMREQFMGINDGTWTPINTREELHRYDPYAFEVFKRIFFTGELGLWYTDDQGNSHVGDPNYRVMPEDWELLRDQNPEFKNWTSVDDLIAWGATIPEIARYNPYTGEHNPHVNWISWNTPNVWDISLIKDPAVSTNKFDFVGRDAYNQASPSPTQSQTHPFFRVGGVKKPVRPAEVEALIMPVKCKIVNGTITTPRPVLVQFELKEFNNDITRNNAQTSFDLKVNGKQKHFYFWDFKKDGDLAEVTLRLDWPLENGDAITVAELDAYKDSGRGSTVVNASISPKKAEFDKNTDNANYKDIAVTLTKGSYNLSKITLGGKEVSTDKDYTVSGSTVTFKKEYLATLDEGEKAFTFDMSGGTDPVLKITVNNTKKTDAGEEIVFDDVKADDWFYNAVKYVNEKGIMKGVGGNNFAPYENMDRAMIVTILYRLEGSPAVTSANPFNDVNGEQYYANAVIWAAGNKIVSGYGNGKFGPNDLITREQMVVILMNYAKFKGYDISATEDLSKFSDSVAVSEWAKGAMAWANGEVLIQGTDGRLMPQAGTQRSQAAAILQRFIENIAK